VSELWVFLAVAISSVLFGVGTGLSYANSVAERRIERLQRELVAQKEWKSRIRERFSEVFSLVGERGRKLRALKQENQNLRAKVRRLEVAAYSPEVKS